MNEKFPLILKSLRKSNGYTQKELAKLLNLGQTTIANYENGIRIPDIIKLEEIADLFEVSIDYLLGRNKDSFQRYEFDYKNKVDYSDLSYNDYMSNLLNGNKDESMGICLSLLERGMDISKIYQNIIEPSLIETGTLWEKGTIDIWKEHFITEVSLDIMRTLNSKFIQNKKNNRRVIALTPGSEMHNIGLKMVCNIFELAGWNSIFLGSNVPTLSVLDAINEKKPDVVALSVTMPHHIESANYLIQAIREIYSKDSLRIIVGGSGFSAYDTMVEINEVDCFLHNLEELISQLDKFI